MTKFRDVSQMFSPSMSIPPGSAAPSFLRLMQAGQGSLASVSEYTFSSHLGTHIDAPAHYFPDQPTLDLLPIDRFAGKGFVVPLRKAPLTKIYASELIPFTAQLEQVQFALLSCGWARHFGTAEYFNHPFLSVEAALLLVQLGIQCLVLDTLTPDQPISLRDANYDAPVHKTLLGAGILILENSASLEWAEGMLVDVFAFPIFIKDSDGAPTRLVLSKSGEALAEIGGSG